MQLLSKYFPMLEDELSNVVRMSQFLAIFKVPIFLKSPIAAAAPRVDLMFINQMWRYREFDVEVAEAALAASYRHLW